MSDVLLKVENLKKYFPIYHGLFRKHVGDVKAVDDVTFSIRRGETVGLVGESGCGKTTTGRAILRLIEPTDGRVLFYSEDSSDPIDVTAIGSKELRRLRRRMQMIFQDPFASLNPRMSVQEIIGEPLFGYNLGTNQQRRERVAELMELVGLDPNLMSRYPHAFSGGQRQRIGIARALALNPDLIIADEAVSALDVSIQAQILNLLRDLQERFHLTYLFISHDLGVVRHLCDRVAVMYLGKVVEFSPTESLFGNPHHPYVETLLSAVPRPNPYHQSAFKVSSGEVGDPSDRPTGCAFHPRCPYAQDICREEEPPLVRHANDSGERWSACHFVDELQLEGITPGASLERNSSGLVTE